MVNLIVYKDTPPPAAPTADTVFGGYATLNLQSEYPVCRECGEPMLFLGQIPSLRDPFGSFIALFQCSASEGMCETWEPDSGTNAAIRVQRDQPLVSAPAPEQATVNTTSPHRYVGELHELTETYNAARAQHRERTGQSARAILGYVGGEPAWIQGDESPHCDIDGTTMTFVALIEEGIVSKETFSPMMNFGGGAAYVFECKHQAKYIWQQ